MSKSNLLNNKLITKSNFALLCILVMMAGFLASRAAISMAMIAFGVVGILGVHPREWLKNKWWLWGAAWLAFYLISYFWSDDKGYWWEHCQVKMPILLLPLAFGFLPKFTVKQQEIFTAVVGILLLAGACYSISFLIRDTEHYTNGYLYARLLPTPAKNDHIRFSLSIALYVTWCFYFWPQMKAGLRWFTGVMVILLALYLHILAAKSGLIALYMLLIGWALYVTIARKKVIGIISLVVILLGAYLAVNFIPTLKNRARHLYFTYYLYEKKDSSVAYYGDAARLLSYNVAETIIKAHPVNGVGVGDMFAETKKVYAEKYPAIPEQNILLPHDQFLVVTIACGVLAGLIFAVWAFYPLFWLRRNRESFFMFLVWASLLLQLLAEPILEIQYGVFVYLFFLLWQKHTLPAKQALQTKD